MGFLDRFKKTGKQDTRNVTNNREAAEQLPFDVSYSRIANGNLQVEFHDRNADFKKFYDSTRLIIDKEPFYMEGHQVYRCAVSWYGDSDCRVWDAREERYNSLRAQDYQRVLAEIDLELLQTDVNYCNMVMKGLLDKQRVEKYLENGLQETPEYPCGEYIGGVRKKEQSYNKFFSTVVGRASHNSESMVNKRQQYREKMEKQRQEAIENKEAQIAKLQSEIDNLEK